MAGTSCDSSDHCRDGHPCQSYRSVLECPAPQMCHLSPQDQHVCQSHHGIAEAVTGVLGRAQFPSCSLYHPRSSRSRFRSTRKAAICAGNFPDSNGIVKIPAASGGAFRAGGHYADIARSASTCPSKEAIYYVGGICPPNPLTRMPFLPTASSGASWHDFVAHGQLLQQPVFALAQRADPSPDRGHMLPEGEVDPLHKGRVDVPTPWG